MSDSSGVHHTMIVTATSNADLEVSYPSTNRLNWPRSRVVAASPHDSLIYWKLRNAI